MIAQPLDLIDTFLGYVFHEVSVVFGYIGAGEHEILPNHHA